MAEAALIAKLEVKLATLEKQLKKAGVLADNSVREIEGKFAKANPKIGGMLGAGALGGFIGALRPVSSAALCGR